MGIIVELTISGLIALVPNVADHPSELSAYVLVDPMQDHAPSLTIKGGEVLDLGSDDGQTTKCSQVNADIRCDLGKVDIRIERQSERLENYFPSGPKRKMPVSADDKSLLNWVVRMSNLEGLTGRVKPWDDLKEKLVGARLTFGWEAAAVTELDGAEVNKVAKIGFRDTSQNKIDLVQAVAESVLFQLPLDPGPLAITLFDRDAKTARTITVKCGGTKCVSIELSNNYVGPVVCGDGDHFKHYYGIVRNPGQRLIPYSVDSRDYCSDAKPSMGADTKPKVQDRLICPPVLLEP